MLITGELLEQILLSQTLTVLILGSELNRNLKVRHDGRMVDGVLLNLIQDLNRALKRLGHILKQSVHLLGGLEPLLLGVTHQVGVIGRTSGREAYQQFVGIGILLIKEMDIVGADQLYAELARHLNEMFVHVLLQGERLMVGIGYCGLVTLQFQIVVLTEKVMEPLDHLLGLIYLSCGDEFGDLTAQTCRAADYALVILFQIIFVSTGM